MIGSMTESSLRCWAKILVFNEISQGTYQVAILDNSDRFFLMLMAGLFNREKVINIIIADIKIDISAVSQAYQGL